MFQIWIGIGEVVEVGQPKMVGESNNQVLQFKLLTYDTYNDIRTDTMHHITIWGKNVPTFLTSYSVGDIIEVRGHVKTKSWIGNDGERRYRTYVQANSLKKLDLSGLNLKELVDSNKENELPF